MAINYDYQMLRQLGQGGINEQLQQAEQGQRQAMVQQTQMETAKAQREKLLQDALDNRTAKQNAMHAAILNVEPEKQAAIYQALLPNMQALNPGNKLPDQFDPAAAQFARAAVIGPEKLADLEMKKQTAADTNDYRTEMLALQREKVGATAAAAEESRALKSQLAAERGAQQYGSAIDKEGLNDLLSSVNNAVTALEPYSGAGADVPGFGKVEGYMPSIVLPQAAKDLRQAYSGVRNSILKARSGGAVTESEASRLLEELGEGGGKADSQAITGMQNVSQFLRDRFTNIQAGYAPEAVALYKERGGKATSDNVKSLKGAAQAPQAGGWKIERID